MFQSVACHPYFKDKVPADWFCKTIPVDGSRGTIIGIDAWCGSDDKAIIVMMADTSIFAASIGAVRTIIENDL